MFTVLGLLFLLVFAVSRFLRVFVLLVVVAGMVVCFLFGFVAAGVDCLTCCLFLILLVCLIC